MFRSKKRAVAIFGGAVATVAVAAVAFAAYTSTGGFDANGATADEPQNLTAYAAGSSIEQLYPGRCSDVTLGFTNPNDHAAKIDIAHANLAQITTLQLNGVNDGKLVINPNLDYPAATAAATALEVPAFGTASFTVPNLLCLSGSATNADAGHGVHLSGSVPFVMANESEYNG